MSASQHIFAGLKRTRDQKLSSGLKSGQLNLASLSHRRGTSAVGFVTAHLRGFEEDSRPEVNLTSFFNESGYFYVRLYRTGLGFQAIIVKGQVLLSASQHIFTG